MYWKTDISVDHSLVKLVVTEFFKFTLLKKNQQFKATTTEIVISLNPNVPVPI